MSSGERELGLRREQASTCLYSRGGERPQTCHELPVRDE